MTKTKNPPPPQPEFPIERDRRRPPIGPTADAMDMHIHSFYSDAPGNTLETITEACRRRRIGAAVADHNEIRGAVRLFEKQEILVLPAIEVGSSERLEFIAYFENPGDLERFYRDSVEPFKRSRFFAKLTRSFVDLIPAAKEAGALICLPHPFAPSYKNVNFGRKRKETLFNPEFFSKIDLVEVLNGHMADHRNFKAFMLSEIFDKNVTAGSDAHRPKDIGGFFLRFDREIDSRGVYSLLRFPIKVGRTERYSIANFARTSGSVIPQHLQLFFSRKQQRVWMMKYEREEKDENGGPHGAAGGSAKR